MADSEVPSDIVCRICFESEDAGNLVEPCGCSGTHAYVHDACLLRWRRLQVFQGKLSAAARCEICGQKYATSLEQPRKPLMAQVREFGKVVAETLTGLVVCCISSPQSLLSPFPMLVLGLPGLVFGIRGGALSYLLVFPTFILFLYINGTKLSVLGGPGQYHIGLTSFGAPVDGLQRGMLLVSIGAGGPFERTVLYVLEHGDSGTLALIVNKPKKDNCALRNGLTVSIRSGGPLQQGLFRIHNLSGVPGAERIIQGQSVFLSRSDIDLAVARPEKQDASMICVQGFSSWGCHQLEGEVRRGAWGWIKPEHVQAGDVLEMDKEILVGSWERLLNSPHLQIFEG